ncbi:type III PLP-dependent enzyme [Streptomyces silvisoli]|uniref:type III PLP-dependent enzyme n=1 Tax=Streptomyces silvisoli TaxID=3034235 RepID=UPI0037042469
MITEAVRDHVRALPDDQLPAYVYDIAALRAHARRVRDALPERVELYYAAKANPDPQILAALRRAVTGYEVASGGELAHVRRAVPGAPVAFGGPGKTPGELAAAAGTGVTRLHVESERELRLLAGAVGPGRRADILLRVNLPVELRGVPLAMGGPSPFGLDPAGVHRCLSLLARPDFARLRLRGIHAHLASGLDAGAQLAVAERIVDWAVRLPVPIEEVNTGGGMAVDYADPAARFDWAAFGAGLDRLLRRHPGLRLRIEPGRALTAYCGWYATEVLDVKSAHGEDFAVLRGGTQHLRTPVTKGHDQPFTVLPVDDWPYPWPRPVVRGQRATLTGQLCTPKDVFARAVPGAAGLRPADRVVFALAGAYAWNISHHGFLMHPHPGFHHLGRD